MQQEVEDKEYDNEYLQIEIHFNHLHNLVFSILRELFYELFAQREVASLDVFVSVVRRIKRARCQDGILYILAVRVHLFFG